ADLDLVAYVSMAFGNPYGDPSNEDELRTAIARIAGLGIRAISLADTVGLADAKLIHQVVTNVMKSSNACEIGVHLHSTAAEAIKNRLNVFARSGKIDAAEKLAGRGSTGFNPPLDPACSGIVLSKRKRQRLGFVLPMVERTA